MSICASEEMSGFSPSAALLLVATLQHTGDGGGAQLLWRHVTKRLRILQFNVVICETISARATSSALSAWQLQNLKAAAYSGRQGRRSRRQVHP
jgi:hypothetical protein